MDEILLQAAAAARRAGQAIMQLHGKNFASETKSGELVTEADLLSDRIIKEEFARYEWPILSEESLTANRLGAEYVWIVDPLDGTKSFVEGGEDFSVMIGLVHHGEPIVSVTYQPALDKLYTARRGGGAFLTTGKKKTRLKVSTISNGKEARVITSRYHPTPEMETLREALGATRIERAASNGIKIGLIAEGRFDLLFNPTDKMGEWDLCAPQLILEEAGGRVTGVQGEKFIYNKQMTRNPYGILATNGALHAEALAKIRLIINGKSSLNREQSATGLVVWLTGLSGSGKSTLAETVKEKLETSGKRVSIIDGDAVRGTHPRRLGFSREDIRENNRRIAELAREKSASHHVVLVPVISPYEEDRARNRAIVGEKYIEVFVDCPLALCEERDVKGLYRKARAGEITNLIGISSMHPYEKPTAPDMVINTGKTTAKEGAAQILESISQLI